jgi:hypothetical protein
MMFGCIEMRLQACLPVRTIGYDLHTFAGNSDPGNWHRSPLGKQATEPASATRKIVIALPPSAEMVNVVLRGSKIRAASDISDMSDDRASARLPRFRL